MSYIVNPYWYSPACSDTDASAFITATGITNSTIILAICKLVTALKDNGIWTKCSAIYPMVGGTATTHKFNLKNPLDTNAAFRLTFTGGITHSSTGVLPNGVNGWAETYYNPSINMNLSDGHISYYSRTNSNGNYSEMSIWNSSTTWVELSVRYSGSTYYAINNYEQSLVNANSQGYYISNRPNSTTLNFFKNNVKTQITNSVATRVNGTLPLFVQKNVPVNTFSYYTNRECAFATIGNGLTDTEAANLNSIVLQFQTTLGRNV
jgi:hypothetical protein